MAETKVQSTQVVNDAALPELGSAARADLAVISANIAQALRTPLRLSQAAAADSKLYIAANVVQKPDGSSLSTPPQSSTIPSVVASTIDFQTGSTTGATFSITFPASTVGQFRRMGISLLSTGTISCLFSAEAASVGALVNAGSPTVIDINGIPVGYVDLECTQASPALFKTAGSATDVVEASVSGTSRIFMFGAGGSGGGGGAGGLAAIQEIPTGTIDGSNTVFTLAQTPFAASAVQVYLNGVYRTPTTDYTISGSTITFVVAPPNASKVEAAYLIESTPIDTVAPLTEYITLTSTDITNKYITLSFAPAVASTTMVDLLGGSAQKYTTDFIVSGSQVQWTGLGLDGLLAAGDVLRVHYFY
jgi:hypothetical protein